MILNIDLYIVVVVVFVVTSSSSSSVGRGAIGLCVGHCLGGCLVAGRRGRNCSYQRVCRWFSIRDSTDLHGFLFFTVQYIEHIDHNRNQ